MVLLSSQHKLMTIKVLVLVPRTSSRRALPATRARGRKWRNSPPPTEQRTLRSRVRSSRQPPTQPPPHRTTRRRPRSQSPEAPALVTGAGSSWSGPVSESGASFLERRALGGTDSLSHLPRAVTTTRFGSGEGMGPRRADQLGTAVVTVAMQAASAFHPNGGVVLQAALTGQAANDEHGASEHDRHTTRTNGSS